MDNKDNIFTPLEIDAIGEILNISLGASATAISSMLSKRVEITTPDVKVLTYDEFEFTELEPAVGVEITYIEGLQGNNVLLLKREDIKAIVEILMSTEIPDDEFELDEMNISAVCEVMNQLMGASSTALSDFLKETINISTPISFEVKNSGEFKERYFDKEEPMIVVRFRLNIEDKIDSEFINLLPIELIRRLIKSFSLSSTESEFDEGTSPPAQVAQPQPLQPAAQPVAPPPPPVAPQPAPGPAVQQFAPEHTVQQSAYSGSMVTMEVPTAPRMINAMPHHTGSYENVQLNTLAVEQPTNLNLIKSVPLQISVEIGRTRMPLKEILEFGQGTLVMLDKLAGDYVDLFVNGQCIAKGDVVVVDDSFGIRITEIIKNSMTN